MNESQLDSFRDMVSSLNLTREKIRERVEEKIEKAKSHLNLLKSSYMNDGNNGTDDTSPTFKAFEEGSETMSKESNVQLPERTGKARWL